MVVTRGSKIYVSYFIISLMAVIVSALAFSGYVAAEVSGSDIERQDLNKEVQAVNWKGYYGEVEEGGSEGTELLYAVREEFDVDLGSLEQLEGLESSAEVADTEYLPNQGVESAENTYSNLSSPPVGTMEETVALETGGGFNNYLYSTEEDYPVFVVEIERGSEGFNGEELDFELLLPVEDGSEDYSFTVETV